MKAPHSILNNAQHNSLPINWVTLVLGVSKDVKHYTKQKIPHFLENLVPVIMKQMKNPQFKESKELIQNMKEVDLHNIKVHHTYILEDDDALVKSVDSKLIEYVAGHNQVVIKRNLFSFSGGFRFEADHFLKFILKVYFHKVPINN